MLYQQKLSWANIEQTSAGTELQERWGMLVCFMKKQIKSNFWQDNQKLFKMIALYLENKVTRGCWEGEQDWDEQQRKHFSSSDKSSNVFTEWCLTGCGHSATWEILCSGPSWAGNADGIRDGVNCASKEAAAEISVGASAVLCPPLQSQRRSRNQNALWSFSGLADAKRQRWCSLPESECFYAEGGRGASPLSLALRKAGKCSCAGNWLATGNIAHSQTP